MTLPSPVQDWIDRAEELLKELKESGGSSGIAKKLETARVIRLSGGVSGQTQFDGSRDVDISTEVAARHAAPSTGCCRKTLFPTSGMRQS